MGKQYLEPLSRKDKTTTLSVSLRGSIAESCRNICETDAKACAEYINLLLATDIEDIIKTYHKDSIVIGRLDELGMYPPDW